MIELLIDRPIHGIALGTLGLAILTHLILHVNLETKKNLNKIEQTLLSFVYVVYTGFTSLVAFEIIKRMFRPLTYDSAIQTLSLIHI